MAQVEALDPALKGLFSHLAVTIHRKKQKQARDITSAAPVAPPKSPPVSQNAGLRDWLVRGALLVGSPLLFFLLLELCLRLLGIGYPTSFFLTRNVNGKEMLVQNDRFGWRFLGRELSRAPVRLLLPKEKSADTCRIFVLGESAAVGDPQPDYGLPRMLQAILTERYPGVRFEVVSAAMTAINSHALLPIARECAARQGDLWVVYMGNNEVVGPFGSGTVFGPKAPPLGLIRGSLALKTTRTGQWLDDLITGISARKTSQQEWGGMTMFLQNQVRHDDPRMERVYSHFERNLSDMLDAAAAHGTKAIVCSVASNLRDCAPFGSQHAPAPSGAQLRAWNESWQAGVEAQTNGNAALALEKFDVAAANDSAFAELHFRRGLALLALGRAEEARRAFVRARDLDTLRFRADTRLNEIAQRVTLGRESVHFLDAEELLAAHSPGRLPGNDLFYEHVHFTFEGNYWLARAVAEEAARMLPQLQRQPGGDRPWPTPADCARRLAWTDRDRYETLRLVIARLGDPPFTSQLTHDAEVQRLQTQMEALLPAIRPGALTNAAAQYRRAVEQSPGDWVLLQGQARLLKKMGDFAGAVAVLRRVAELMGPSKELHLQIGLLLNEQNRSEEAIGEFRSALRLDPLLVDALNGLGVALAQQKNYAAAVTEYEKALKLRPYSIDAHLNLANTLSALGKTEAAAEHFRLGMRRKPVNAEDLTLLGKFCMKEGLVREALTNFAAAVRLDPTDATARFCLGLAQIAAGNRPAAEGAFAEAVRLNPAFPEALVGLGIELGRRGQDAAALEHFASAARLKPDFVEAHLNLGIALLTQGRREEAMSEFKETLRLDPNNATARRYIEGNGGR